MIRLLRRWIFWALDLLDPDDDSPDIYERPARDLDDSAVLAEAIWRETQAGPH
jgi:hypothetical protein